MSLTCPLQSLLKQQFSTFFQVLVLVNQFDSVDRYFQQRQSEQFKCISFYADWLYTVSGWMVETKLCLSSARRTERAILRGFDSCNKARLYTGICRIRSWFGKKCPHSLHFSPWWKISRTTSIDGWDWFFVAAGENVRVIGKEWHFSITSLWPLVNLNLPWLYSWQCFAGIRHGMAEQWASVSRIKLHPTTHREFSHLFTMPRISFLASFPQ